MCQGDNCREVGTDQLLYLAGPSLCCNMVYIHIALSCVGLYSRTALDLALVNGHREVADYLISQGVPSGGGMFHRAALTIQAVWRLHRYRVRQNLPCNVSLYMLCMCVCCSVDVDPDSSGVL